MTFSDCTNLLRNDKTLLGILLAGLVIQIITAITAIGAYHPDQHAHIVEYGMHYLGLPNAVYALWELDEQMMPTLKMFMFMAYYKVSMFIGLEDRYTMLTVLRIVCGILALLVPVLILLRNLGKGERWILVLSMILLCFSGWFPFVRSAYSAEILSGILFFGGLIYYQFKSGDHGISLLNATIVGFIFSLAFFARFQIAFAGIGFILWVVWKEKNWINILLYISAGFLLGFALNIFLDSLYYGNLTSTPYHYFRVNIVEGKAASFGTQSFVFYLYILAAVLFAPLISLFFFGAFLRGCWKRLKDPYVLSSIVFLLGHFVVGHKEDRFLFPLFGILPLIAAYGLDGFDKTYKKWHTGFKVAFGIVVLLSVVINLFALSFFMTTPYSQGLHFGKKVNRFYQEADAPTALYCHRRHPFESESKTPQVWYYEAFNKDVELISNDTLSVLIEQFPEEEKVYLVSTYNNLHRNEENLALVEGMTPVFYSSKFLWNLNEFLRSKEMNTINEIWIMYERGERGEGRGD